MKSFVQWLEDVSVAQAAPASPVATTSDSIAPYAKPISSIVVRQFPHKNKRHKRRKKK